MTVLEVVLILGKWVIGATALVIAVLKFIVPVFKFIVPPRDSKKATARHIEDKWRSYEKLSGVNSPDPLGLRILFAIKDRWYLETLRLEEEKMRACIINMYDPEEKRLVGQVPFACKVFVFREEKCQQQIKARRAAAAAANDNDKPEKKKVTR